MEDNPSCQNNIIKIFIKMLDNYQNEFIVFYPYILNYTKNTLQIPCQNHFKEFRFGLEKNEIISLITKENLNKKSILPNVGNIIISNENNNLNKSTDSSFERSCSLNQSNNSSSSAILIKL